MKNTADKREWEKSIISEMIALYCADNHKDRPHNANGLCEECAELTQYACARTDRCPKMETKTFCSNCPVHCYKPQMREKIRVVMRYAGPRMMFHHPVHALRHLYWSRREQRELAKATQKDSR